MKKTIKVEPGFLEHMIEVVPEVYKTKTHIVLKHDPRTHIATFIIKSEITETEVTIHIDEWYQPYKVATLPSGVQKITFDDPLSMEEAVDNFLCVPLCKDVLRFGENLDAVGTWKGKRRTILAGVIE